ncbi:hypothetical protein [Paenibacillus medicaginis]|uniref:Uncharacterized protein n=1 Tax=Paenibacillus medicaginis TaxID=1470560 RepID=A0ABV5C8U9_9BACL
MSNRVTRKYKDLIFKQKRKPIDAFTTLKNNESLVDIRDLLLEFDKIKIYNSYLFGKSLPTSYAELGESRSLYFVKSFEKQLNWLTLNIERFSKEINQFLILKVKFEKYFLLGDYDKATEIIEMINKKICYSLWSIENRLIIGEHQGGLEKNKEILSEINSENKNKIVAIFSDFLSRRIEKNVSVQKYIETLDKYLEKVTGSNEALIEYFNFKLNFFNYGEFNFFSEIMHTDTILSIIDRYISFISICQIILGDDRFSCYHELVLQNVLILKSSITDVQLDRLILFKIPQRIRDHDSNGKQLEPEFLSILDKYTLGDHEEALIESANFILQHPNSLQVYEIYLKSFINLGNPKEKLLKTEKESIFTEIISHMYNVYMKNEKTNESINYLKKINCVLGTNSINKMLFSFLRDSISYSNSKQTAFMFQINSHFISPKFSEVYNNIEDSLNFMENIGEYYLNSISVQFFLNYYRQLSTEKDVDDLTIVPLMRAKRYRAGINVKKGNYSKAIEIYEELINKRDLSEGYLYETIALNLYSCYLEDNLLDKALDLAIGNYLNNKYLIIRFDLNKLLVSLENNKEFEDLNTEICLVILNFVLFSIHDTKGQRKIYSSYATFLRANGFEKPTDIKETTSVYDKRELIFFLQNVCVTMIMDSSYYFDSPEEIDNERISICQWLCELDPENKDIYMNEMSAITKNSMVLKRIQEVEESKIYVDTDGIQKSIDQSFKESFDRYRQFVSFNKEELLKMKIMDLFIENGIVDLEQIVIYETGEPLSRFSKNYKFLAYKELFVDLRDLFISSNEYGLDSYLSTRIRHGTILSQLRSVFKTENLVTEKDKITGFYINNDYWYKRIGFKQQELNELFNDFSENIDKIILRVPSEWIQIKTEDRNPNGLFNFIFTDLEVYTIYQKNKEINDYQDLMKATFSDLWTRTDKNLSNIKTVLSSVLQEDLISEINELEVNLKSLFEDNSNNERIYDLYRSIATCRTNIQTEIRNVCKWFNLPEDKALKDFKIDELIDTCIEILKKLYPNNDLKYLIKTNIDKHFNGFSFPYFVDIFLILLDNIVKHSSRKVLEQNVNICVEEGEELKICITNNISDDVEEQNSILEKIEDIQSKLKESNLNNIKSEGGSGFFKIKKIINYDLRTIGTLNLYVENNYFCVGISLQTERILVNEYSYN